MIEYKVKVYGDRTEWRNQKDEIHRSDGPAVEWEDGGKSWWKDGKLHRLDGPAVERENGDKYWYVNGNRHRLNGPALEYRDGLKYWYVNGQIHRLDGPAVECPNRDQEWWIEGVKYSKEEFDEKIKQINNSCEGKIVEIDGIKYQLAKV